ncbi:hypothetical protein [Streptomyces sp. 147326]|uniref:hypothetical protein n=1 Tax=Streptomyces sp. 147326 TaxID=3074379 RepID=UPI0038578B04
MSAQVGGLGARCKGALYAMAAAAASRTAALHGHRAILFTSAGHGGRLLPQTRRGSRVRDRFPVLVAVAEQPPEYLLLDGELLVWDTAAGRQPFEALQRRATASGRGTDGGRLAVAGTKTVPCLACSLPNIQRSLGLL